MFMGASILADGCFVFRWNKQKDINEPTQKAIILHDQGHEDLVLQVKYEGPAEDFGWLVPVPGQPEVRQGSMPPFYELSRLTQQHFREDRMNSYGSTHGGRDDEEVKVIEVKTVGSYEVAILSSTNPSALADWLGTHQFSFPKEKQGMLDEYIRRHWFFVAARINPDGGGFVLKSTGAPPAAISASTRAKLAHGELHPIIISFPSQKCVFPLAISSVNGTPSEISLYVLSTDPLLSPVIFERNLNTYRAEKEKSLQMRGSRKKSLEDMRVSVIRDRRARRDSPMATRMNADDPNDPPPTSVFDLPGLGARETEFFEDAEEDFYSPRLQLVRSMLVQADENLKACCHDLPRLTGKRWWLTKLVETFAPEEMVDLEFEPAIPFLAGKLRRENGEGSAHCLPQYGSLAASTVLEAITDSDAAVRGRGLVAAQQISDPRFIAPLLNLLQEDDAKTRVRACYAAGNNWERRFAKPFLKLLDDPEPGVAQAAHYRLRDRLREEPGDFDLDTAALRKILAQDGGPASTFALEVLMTRNKISDTDRKQLFSSTNLPVLSYAFTPLRDKLQAEDVRPLMTNSLPMARLMALGVLARLANKAAVASIVSMLRDPNEAVAWRVRSSLRRLTGQKLGADPAAYENWWAKNKETFVAIVPPRRSRY
jgi:hypothetical protein